MDGWNHNHLYIDRSSTCTCLYLCVRTPRPARPLAWSWSTSIALRGVAIRTPKSVDRKQAMHGGRQAGHKRSTVLAVALRSHACATKAMKARTSGGSGVCTVLCFSRFLRELDRVVQPGVKSIVWTTGGALECTSTFDKQKKSSNKMTRLLLAVSRVEHDRGSASGRFPHEEGRDTGSKIFCLSC